MSWEELRKKGNKIYNLAHYAKRKKTRKKNMKRLERFKKKYNIPVGPIPELAVGGMWGDLMHSGKMAITYSTMDKMTFGANIAL